MPSSLRLHKTAYDPMGDATSYFGSTTTGDYSSSDTGVTDDFVNHSQQRARQLDTGVRKPETIPGESVRLSDASKKYWRWFGDHAKGIGAKVYQGMWKGTNLMSQLGLGGLKNLQQLNNTAAYGMAYPFYAAADIFSDETTPRKWRDKWRNDYTRDKEYLHTNSVLERPAAAMAEVNAAVQNHPGLNKAVKTMEDQLPDDKWSKAAPCLADAGGFMLGALPLVSPVFKARSPFTTALSGATKHIGRAGKFVLPYSYVTTAMARGVPAADLATGFTHVNPTDSPGLRAAKRFTRRVVPSLGAALNPVAAADYAYNWSPASVRNTAQSLVLGANGLVSDAGHPYGQAGKAADEVIRYSPSIRRAYEATKEWLAQPMDKEQVRRMAEKGADKLKESGNLLLDWSNTEAGLRAQDAVADVLAEDGDVRKAVFQNAPPILYLRLMGMQDSARPFFSKMTPENRRAALSGIRQGVRTLQNTPNALVGLLGRRGTANLSAVTDTLDSVHDAVRETKDKMLVSPSDKIYPAVRAMLQRHGYGQRLPEQLSGRTRHIADAAIRGVAVKGGRSAKQQLAQLWKNHIATQGKDIN